MSSESLNAQGFNGVVAAWPIDPARDHQPRGVRGPLRQPRFRRGVCGYTRETDTRAVLTLVCHARPRRVLEVGTVLGHVTATLTRWTSDDARVFTLDLAPGMSRRMPGAAVSKARCRTASSEAVR